MPKVNQDWKQLLRDIFDIVRNVEGAGLVNEMDSLLNDYDRYLRTTPLPVPVARWFDDLIDMMNNVEGAELERELKGLRLPKASV